MIRGIIIYNNILYYSPAQIPDMLIYLELDTKFLEVDQCQVLNYQGRCRITGNKFIEDNLPLITKLLGDIPFKFIRNKCESKNTQIDKTIYLPIELSYMEDLEIKVSRL